MSVLGEDERTPLIQNALVEREETRYYVARQRVAYWQRRLKRQSSWWHPRKFVGFFNPNNRSCLRVLKILSISCMIIAIGLLLFLLRREIQGRVPLTPDEIEWYRKSGVYWESPRRLDCLDQYNYREYSARLQNISHVRGFNVLKACKAMSIEISNQRFETPRHCTRSGTEVYGLWTVYDAQDCTVEDEKKRYRNSGMFWSVPSPADHCHSYDKRKYIARLYNIPAGYDWYKACQYIPIRVQDQVLEEPASCWKSESWLGEACFYGTWMVGAQLDCRPYWGPLKFVGCQASGKKRYEAELWNLIPGDDFYEMCYTTPATWHGRYYEHPSACDYRAKRGGMIGIWDIENC